jgi:hypothetical protein
LSEAVARLTQIARAVWPMRYDANPMTRWLEQERAWRAARKEEEEAPRRAAVRAEAAAQADLVRDLFGNPFRRLCVPKAWLRTTGQQAVEIARAIYEDRSFDELGILADALEEAGCTDIDVLEHLRGPGAHVRGCWAIDLIVGKK